MFGWVSCVLLESKHSGIESSSGPNEAVVEQRYLYKIERPVPPGTDLWVRDGGDGIMGTVSILQRADCASILNSTRKLEKMGGGMKMPRIGKKNH